MLSKMIKLVEQQLSLQPADRSARSKAVQVWSWGNVYSPKPGKWLSHHLYLETNIGFYARENFSEETLWNVVKLVSYMKQ